VSLQIIVRAVGGQILPYVVRRLATLLTARGHRVTIEESYGMAQRGGAVVATLAVELAAAAPHQRVLIGLERLEGLRGLPALGAGDVAFVSTSAWVPPGPSVAAIPSSTELQSLAAETGIEIHEVDAPVATPWAVAQAAVDRLSIFRSAAPPP